MSLYGQQRQPEQQQVVMTPEEAKARAKANYTATVRPLCSWPYASARRMGNAVVRPVLTPLLPASAESFLTPVFYPVSASGKPQKKKSSDVDSVYAAPAAAADVKAAERAAELAALLEIKYVATISREMLLKHLKLTKNDPKFLITGLEIVKVSGAFPFEMGLTIEVIERDESTPLAFETGMAKRVLIGPTASSRSASKSKSGDKQTILEFDHVLTFDGTTREASNGLQPIPLAKFLTTDDFEDISRYATVTVADLDRVQGYTNSDAATVPAAAASASAAPLLDPFANANVFEDGTSVEPRGGRSDTAKPYDYYLVSPTLPVESGTGDRANAICFIGQKNPRLGHIYPVPIDPRGTGALTHLRMRASDYEEFKAGITGYIKSRNRTISNKDGYLRITLTPIAFKSIDRHLESQLPPSLEFKFSAMSFLVNTEHITEPGNPSVYWQVPDTLEHMRNLIPAAASGGSSA
jgi:hypothetical protein